ncbi:MAG: YcaQ family DNA glycosylase [Microbacteriaceae bacterium]|nr:YcaQ family DNA glycosylase [Microbacteriaceae bacterium]
MVDSLSLLQARKIALASQGFGKTNNSSVGSRDLSKIVDKLGLLQIDSVNVFERSHYLPLFARLGAFDKQQLDRLTFVKGAKYLEYWAHVASLIPRESWPLFRWRMEQYRSEGSDWNLWAQEHKTTVQWLLGELRTKGPLPASEIEHDLNRRTGPWWGWSEVKTALEALFRSGEVVSAGRKRFERVYGLPDQVLPAEILERQVPIAQAQAMLVEHAVKALGVGTLKDIADYYRLKSTEAKVALEQLESSGLVQQVSVEGWKQPAWMPIGSTIPRKIEAAAFLSPFDPIVWERSRAARLFNFEYLIEIYTPAPKRKFGYYNLPILIDHEIVGRIDLKSDRKLRVLKVQSAWVEAGQDANQVAQRIAPLLRQTANWQGLEDICVTNWGNLASNVAATTGAALYSRED